MNIICIPFAFEQNKISRGHQINKDNEAVISRYLEDACVACASAKHYNPNDRVLFVTNMEKAKIKASIRRCLEDHGVEIHTIPYSSFVFDDQYAWSLAFFKLCAFEYISTLEFDCCCYMDSDVFVKRSFDTIWEECAQHIMLYDTMHGLYNQGNASLWEEVQLFCGERKLITHWGGEFFAANKENALIILDAMRRIYQRMITEGFVTKRGDEFILSLAADECKQLVKNAGAYVMRIWTTVKYRLVSNAYRHEDMVVLHMPIEKSLGLRKIYRKYVSKGKIPTNEKVYRLCHLKNRGLVNAAKYYIGVKLLRM